MICTIISTGEELLSDCRNEHEKNCVKIKNQLREMIWELYCQGYTGFYVNCEYGIPLWTAEIICALKIYNDIQLYIAIPYEEQTTNWYEEHRDRYFAVHEKADAVQIVNKKFFSGCYDSANKFMINESNLLVIIGEIKKAEDTVKYAEEIKIPVSHSLLFV